jgi:DNA uptake protein ComE-like DNA-binding protein
MSEKQATREDVAGALEQIADLLQVQDANPFRVQSYRDGAQTVRTTEKPIIKLAAQGDTDALQDLANIGEGLSQVIVEYVQTGRSSLLDDLKGEVSPEELLQQVPEIGPTLASRIVDKLDIHSLQALEQAAYDGSLATVEGIGAGRLKAVRTSLAGMLGRSAQRHQRRMAAAAGGTARHPSIALLLSIDQAYRQRAAAGDLKRIAPKRFNPENKAWLPIMRETREGWQFTVLYSNTARAHELDKTHDWVVIYYKPEDGGDEDQSTVVTASSGPLAGKRVVRGREEATRRYYAQQEAS